MTEQQVKREIERHIWYLRLNWKPHPDYDVIEALKEAIYALDKLEQYRAIGTVEELKSLQGDYWKVNEICKIYSKIGTVEKFKELIRNKAIDEFVAKAEEWNNNIESIRNEDGFFTIENIRKIAEQMKAGE